MEHRWGRRVVVDIPIHITAANISAMRSAQLANLSITGALIEADFRPRLLSRIEIVIESSLGHGDAVSIAAYVARHCQDGFGVEWCDSGSRGLIFSRGREPALQGGKDGVRVALHTPKRL